MLKFGSNNVPFYNIANGVMSAYKRNVIGAGYTLRARTGNEELNKAIQDEWREWCKAKNCDITGMQPFMAMMRMVEVRKRIDGGILLKKCFVKGGKIPFKIQAIEVDEIDQMAIGKVHKRENKIVAGIEYDKYNKIEGFWIRRYDIDGWGIEDSVYVDAKDMIFMFSKSRPSQIREISDMAQSITRIRDANEYMTAVSVKERIAACLAIFIKNKHPESLGRPGTKNISKKTYEGKTITPGMIRELNPGDEIDVVNPSGQAADATGMIKLHQRMIGAGQGLSYEATSRDMSQSNYSSARQGAIEDGLTYIEDRELILELVLDEIYETFIMAAWLSGALAIKDFLKNKEEYLKHDWVAQPKPWIDPKKEADANKTALQKGMKTFQQIAAESGKDWKEQINDMAEAIEYARKKGVELGGILYEKQEEGEVLKDEEE